MAAEERTSRAGSAAPRAFWSGTLTFGLVTIPVELYPGVRPQRVPLRMLAPDGQPLQRRYTSQSGRPLAEDEIVRGYPLSEGRFVPVTDDELAGLQPRRTRDIELLRFVDQRQIDAIFFERPYVLAPAGRSTRAYHLLAEVMARENRAGIATFVMRGKQYLAAVFSEGGLLRATTLRFADEVRTPSDVGLPPVAAAPPALRRRMEAAIDAQAADELPADVLRAERDERLAELVAAKREAGRDLVEVPEEIAAEHADDELVDVMAVLKQRIGAAVAGSR